MNTQGGQSKAGIAQFRKGDRIVCFGDSKTEMGFYPFALQLLCQLRKPQAGIRVENCGKSGETAKRGCARWPLDGRPLGCNRALVLYGSNDIGREDWREEVPSDNAIVRRRNAALADFGIWLPKCVDAILADGVRAEIVSPAPFDEWGNQPNLRELKLANRALGRCREIARKTAEEKALGFSDIFEPLSEIYRRRPDLGFTGDRIHPDPAASLLMACRIWLDSGEPGEFAWTEADAGGATSFAMEMEPSALPLPVEDRYRKLDKAWPVTELVNRDILAVSNLAAGTYAIKTDGRTLGVFPAGVLAAGVNIAVLETPCQESARKVSGICAKLAELVRTRLLRGQVVREIGESGFSLYDAGGLASFFARERKAAEALPWKDFRKHVLDTAERTIPLGEELAAEEERLRKELGEIRPFRYRIEIERIGGA